MPDLVPYWNLVAPRISARVATEVFFNLGPREVKFHLFVAIIGFPLGLELFSFKERWKFPSVFDGFNITDSQHIVNQFFLSRSFRVSRSEPLFLSI